MRKLFTLLLALFCFTGIWAEDVTEEQALEQALDFLANQTTASGRPRHAQGTTPQLSLASKVSGLYVFNVKDEGGYVIVSNDDRTIPVLGFSENGKFDANNMPDNMKAWLQGYADEIAWLKQNNITTTGPKKVRSKVGSHSTTAVAPLCTSTWYQDAPYNNQCPTYNSWSGSGRSATGCVATAMAQVMYYHKWPETTTKAIPGYITYSYSMNLSSLPVTTFDWANMIDDYSGSYTTAQGTAVATLMKYCGYSVQMDYGPESGAYTEDVATALIKYFDYNANTTQFVNRSSYTYANWTDLIYHEVANSRPVVYGGMSTGGGHEFVCDGYKYQSGTDFFHINWGWGGMSDNYFVLSALDPDQQGIGGSSSTDGFHYGQDAVIGIQKSTDNGSIADISPNVINLVLNSITFSSNPSEPGAEVNVIFNVTNNSSDDYDGDLWLYLNYEGEFYPIDLQSFVIPAGETQDCIIPYTPEEADTYEFAFGYINAKGEYVVYDNMTATLTVAERTKNEYVPVYGYYCDELSRSQFIIPAANIEDMLNSTINGMTFYAAQTSVNWGAAKFDVYLSEVNSTTINSLKDWNSLEKVYAGSLSINGGKMVINFNDPYYYQGGNLLVGINQTVKGNYSSCSWYGETVNGASVGGYNTSINQQNFLPEVTFDYTAGGTPPLKKPTNLAATEISATSATISWEGTADSYNLRYRAAKGFNYDFESAEAWTYTDFSPCTTYDGDGLKTYGIQGFDMPNANYVGSVIAFSDNSQWEAHNGNTMGAFMAAIPSEEEGGATANDDYFITPELTIASGDHFTFWARSVTTSYGLERMKVGVYGGNGTISNYLAGSASKYVEVPVDWTQYDYDLTAYAGQTIQLAINCVSADAFALLFDDIFVGDPTDDSWDATLTNVTSPYVLNGLSSETKYEVQVQSVGGENTSDWVGITFYTEEASIIEFANDVDNTKLINDLDGQTCNVQLTGRTLYKDGTWNTLCLPFDVTVEGSPLDGADVRTLSNVTLEGETVTLNFTAEGAVTTLTAGTPYIIKWEADDNIVDPVFNGVTINKTINDETFDLGEEESITFKGTYTKTIFAGTDKSILFVGADNKLNYPLAGATIGAFRSYFTLAGLTVSEANGVKFFTNLGDDDDPTAIVNINAKDSDEWYDLNGRKLAGKPSMKGIYVNGGRKVTVK